MEYNNIEGKNHLTPHFSHADIPISPLYLKQGFLAESVSDSIGSD